MASTAKVTKARRTRKDETISKNRQKRVKGIVSERVKQLQAIEKAVRS